MFHRGMKTGDILLNSWEGVVFDIKEETMINMMDDIAKFGGELFVMDDGWFGDKYPRNNDSSSLGDWVVDKRKLPGGISTLTQAARQRGIKFGIWIEVGKRIYAYTLYLLMMAVYTAVNVPYGSLLGVMTDDDNEKNQFSSFRMVGAYAMGFITLLSFPYLQKMVGGTEAHQYAVLGAGLGFLATIMTLACGLLTKERLKPIRAEKFSFQQVGWSRSSSCA